MMAAQSDNEINRRLANCYKAELLFLGPYEKFVTKDGRTIDYKHPAIFAENVEWLLDKGWELAADAIQGYCAMYDEKGDGEYDNAVCNKKLRKAVALARIAASEDGE